MFSKEQYEHLDTIWDGTLDNTKDVCFSCGACCHNAAKTLFPGEYEYLVNKTGQHNSSWVSQGCLCNVVKVKPVICKLYPFMQGNSIPIVGEISIDFTLSAKDFHYSSNCKKLLVTDDNLDKAKKWFEFLFSDVHNRLFYNVEFCIEEIVREEKSHLSALNAKVSKSKLYTRAFKTLIGLDPKELGEYYNFRTDEKA